MSFSSDFSSQDAYVAPGLSDVPSTVFFEAEQEDLQGSRRCGCSKKAVWISIILVVLTLVVAGVVVGITVPLTTGSNHHHSNYSWDTWTYAYYLGDNGMEEGGGCNSDLDCGSGGHCTIPTYCGGAAPPADYFDPVCSYDECQTSSDCPQKTACVQGSPSKICVPTQCDFATGTGCPNQLDRCTVYIAPPCTSVPSQMYCAAPNDPCHSDSDCGYSQYCAAGDCQTFYIAP